MLDKDKNKTLHTAPETGIEGWGIWGSNGGRGLQVTRAWIRRGERSTKRRTRAISPLPSLRARSGDCRHARGEEVPEGEHNLRQQIQEQTVRIGRDFYDDSLERLEGMLQGDRAQLEDLAKQLPEGDAGARIRDMVGSYSKIEESLHRAARDVAAEDAVGEAVWQAQEEAAGEPKRAARGARDAAGVAAGRVTGSVGQASGQVGQIAESAQEAVGQILDRVGQVAENLPGGQLLSRTTNEAGQTVQRAVDESGVIVEITLDEASNLVNQKPVGSLAELPAEEEYQNQEGQTIRTVKEESGTLIKLRLGEDGSILDLQVPPSSKI
jgi:hypothetical protein